MGSEAPVPLVDKVNVMAETPVSRSHLSKIKGKVPKKIHKAEREKLKREHLNDLFLDLANALELTHQHNNRKASVMCEATRILKDMFGQIENLKKENAALLSESLYVSAEKNELREENFALEAQIEKLQSELEARVAQSKPDLNAPPPEIQQPELTSHFPGDCFRLPAVEPTLQQSHTVLVVPMCHDLEDYPAPYTDQLTSNLNSHVSKPHARYPTAADSWPIRLLGKQPTSAKEFLSTGSNDSS